MSDIEITRDATGEFMLIAVTGTSVEGEIFVDAYLASVPERMHVVDSGRIVVDESELDRVLEEAGEQGLAVEVS